MIQPTEHSNRSSAVRVRFAPSPTGYLHIGGLRTALYNYLFARRSGGTFILRIEDTDRSRVVPGAVENLIRTLDWAGLSFDEGPGKDAPSGPFIQSQRVEIYRAHAELLLERGAAYRCFCTSEELDRKRMSQDAASASSMYDRTCRSLSAHVIEEKRTAGTPYTVRLKVPLSGEVECTDAIRGEIRFECAVIDDQVLMKSDGYPTYHLANVVDDHLMAISHVIRGEEWLPSTAKHILLYHAFEWEVPAFAHLPLLLNPDRSKLSKRQGDVAVEDFRTKGYLAEALVNYVALLGWNTSDDREIYSLADLASLFSLDRVSKSGAVFDAEKLLWFNGQYLRALPPAEQLRLCVPFLESAGIPLDDTPRIARIVEAAVPRISLPSEIVAYAEPFFRDGVRFEREELRDLLGTDRAREVLAALMRSAEALPVWDRVSFKELTREVQKNTGAKGKDLFMPIRIALTGQEHGPDLPLVAEILGRDACLARVSDALAR